MKQMIGIAWADFLERSRRFSFLAMVALALFGAFWFMPNNNLNVVLIESTEFMQGGDPSWIPITSAFGLICFLPLMGFFYISNSIAYDEKIGIRQLIATTPAHGLSYIFGKFISNVMLLLAILISVIIGSIVMMMIHFPGQWISPYTLFSPYVVFLPSILLVSALEILFDSTRLLRRSAGAVAYVLTFFTVMLNVTRVVRKEWLIKALDFSGMSLLVQYIGREVLAQSGHPMHSLQILAGPGSAELAGKKLLTFHGVKWVASDIYGLLTMVAISMALVLLARLVYRMTEGIKKKPKHKKSNEVLQVKTLADNLASYTPEAVSVKFSVIKMLSAELRLMISGLRFSWWLVTAGCFLLGIFLPLHYAQMFLPIMLLWLMSIHSSLGCREYLNDTLYYIKILPKGLLRQMISLWISGILISSIMLGPVVVRMLIIGQQMGIFVCFSAAVFIPSLALFLGEWTKTRRAFEVIYVTMAYMSMNGIEQLGYLEVRPDVISMERAIVYLVMGIVMGVLAVCKRSYSRVHR